MSVATRHDEATAFSGGWRPWHAALNGQAAPIELVGGRKRGWVLMCDIDFVRRWREVVRVWPLAANAQCGSVATSRGVMVRVSLPTTRFLRLERLVRSSPWCVCHDAPRAD